MHIRKILIENIRCFDRVELDLTRPDGSLAGWTVLAGRNGTGKSTLLKAIALAVAGPRMADKLQSSFADWIRADAGEAVVRCWLPWAEADAELSPALFWRVPKNGHGEPDLGSSPTDTSVLPPWSPGASGWFIAGYGPLRRLGLRDDYDEPGPPMQARLGSLFNEDATLAESIHWLKDIHADWLSFEHHAEVLNQRGFHPSKVADYRDDAARRRQLYQDILALLNDDLLPLGVSVSGLNERRELVVTQGGVPRHIRSLSDGYRAAIALVLDIVRQMHRCFDKKLDVSRCLIDGKTVVRVNHEGVVLIDEVDAHLHVSWQQRIGFWLKEHFPNVQFIVTTHSPFVCQAADPKGLIRLPAPGSGERVEHVSDDLYNTVVYGDVDDAVMTALFGLERAHSDHAEALRSRVARLQAKMMRGHATPEEKEEMYRLSARLPKTGSFLVQQTLRKLGESG